MPVSNTPAQPPVYLDHESGLAYVHQLNADGKHTVRPGTPDVCDHCTPLVDRITGGNDDSVSPIAPADPEFPGAGVGAACPLYSCPDVLTGRDEDEALAALERHITQWHADIDIETENNK